MGANSHLTMQYLIYITPLTLGLVEAFKRAGISKRYLPLIAIIIGLILSFFLHEGYSTSALVEGLVSALTASGIYSGVKATVKG